MVFLVFISWLIIVLNKSSRCQISDSLAISDLYFCILILSAFWIFSSLKVDLIIYSINIEWVNVRIWIQNRFNHINCPSTYISLILVSNLCIIMNRIIFIILNFLSLIIIFLLFNQFCHLKIPYWTGV